MATDSDVPNIMEEEDDGPPTYDSAERKFARRTAMITSIFFMSYLVALRLIAAKKIRSGLLLSSLCAHIVHLYAIIDLGVSSSKVLLPIVHGVEHHPIGHMLNFVPWFAAYLVGSTGYLALFYLTFRVAAKGDNPSFVAIAIVWSLLLSFYADRLCAALLNTTEGIWFPAAMVAGLGVSFAYSRIWDIENNKTKIP